MTTHLTDSQKQTIRIALAKWMGYEIYEWGVKYPGHDKPTGRGYKSTDEMLPNYPADLNACHGVEVKLTFTERCAFRNTLRGIMSKGLKETVAFSECISASAEHRSLALFRALNLGELGD